MISPEQLHAYLEKLDKGVVAVDLLKIGQNYALNSAHQAYNGKNFLDFAFNVIFLTFFVVFRSENRHEHQNSRTFSRRPRYRAVSRPLLRRLLLGLGMRWSVESLLAICAIARVCLQHCPHRSCGLFRWNSQGEQKTSSRTQ